MKFRKKPVVVEAKQWQPGRECEPFFSVINGALWTEDLNVLLINTLEGCMKCEPGDWVIRGVKGEYYPCKPDIFEATYEKVEE